MKSLRGVEDWGLVVELGLEPGSLYSQPGDHVAVPPEDPCCLPSPLAPLQRGSRGTWAAHFTLPARKHFSNLASYLLHCRRPTL